MRAFRYLFAKELRGLFITPIAYAALAFFLAVMGFVYWFMASVLVQGPSGTSLVTLVYGSPFFWMIMLVLPPILTMRSFAEERRSGTLEILLTAPVSDAAVVLAKFASVFVFWLALWLPTLLYHLLVYYLSAETLPLHPGTIAAGYLGAALTGAMFLAVGIFCSSLCVNQVIAGLLTFTVLVMLFFVGFLESISYLPVIRDVSLYMAVHEHMLAFSRGVIDTRPILYYATMTALALFYTMRSLERRHWA